MHLTRNQMDQQNFGSNILTSLSDMFLNIYEQILEVSDVLALHL